MADDNNSAAGSDASGSDASDVTFPVTPDHVKDFQIMECLGTGSYGSVYRCLGLLDKKPYAIKLVPVAVETYAKAIREVEVLAKMNHPSIVRYYQAWIEESVHELAIGASSEDDLGSLDSDIGSGDSDVDESRRRSSYVLPTVLHTHTLFILMEYCPMSLDTHLKGGVPPTAIALEMVMHIAEALAYMHGQRVIHRDLSRNNIFIDETGRPIIGDFGLAVLGDEDENVPIDSSLSGGHESYRAPEMSSLRITTKVDMYALGLIMLELLYHMPTETERRCVVFPAAKKGSFPPEVDNAHCQTIASLLREDLMVRPSALGAIDLLKLHLGLV